LPFGIKLVAEFLIASSVIKRLGLASFRLTISALVIQGMLPFQYSVIAVEGVPPLKTG